MISYDLLESFASIVKNEKETNDLLNNEIG